ncbi:wiskott-Aldrich syndrome protein family member 2-like [Schistocerca cancellata]|uniref:wiskott-Aldrich syndrome protein family member 2-like n=1 Tax=Schistocerca cancellata TaxID=274614 RepID=UPI0021185518|nr:wiskott-Aldrich syndrome protein family member 2-like [Schistocerca cancellata]
MANVFYLLSLLASLTVWQSAADDQCDSVECLPVPGPLCALNEETGNMALFADECVLRCINCRMTADFKKVNSSLCSTGTTYITVCPDFARNHGNEDTKTEDPDDGIAVIRIDLGQGDGDVYNEVPPVFGESLPVPLPLLSMGSDLLRRLVMSGPPEPPPPPPEGLTLISADVKVDVIINMHGPPPPPPPPPPATRLVLPPPLALPRLPLLAPPPPPPPQRHFPDQRYQPQESDVSSASPQTARPSAIATAVAALAAMVVAARHV